MGPAIMAVERSTVIKLGEDLMILFRCPGLLRARRNRWHGSLCGEWCERCGDSPSDPPWVRVRCTDRVARHRLTPCRVLVGKEGCHFLPPPEQPFGCSRPG